MTAIEALKKMGATNALAARNAKHVSDVMGVDYLIVKKELVNGTQDDTVKMMEPEELEEPIRYYISVKTLNSLESKELSERFLNVVK